MASLRLLAVLFATLCFVPAAGAQISPGPLAEAHAELEGSRQCLSCHTQEKGVDPTKCLGCHTLQQERIERGVGLHSKPGYEPCQTCHIDHHGRDFSLVYWGQEGTAGFNHRLTGYLLDGAHAEATCRDCHQAENILEPDRLSEAEKDLNRTFLGLSRECTSCHEDEHRGQFEATPCSTCHDTEVWVPPSGFDHAATSFALTGSHQAVECAECHVDEGSSDELFTRFRPVAHQECSACHADPHDGGLGPDCASCHQTASWQSTPNFDHARTRFPLTGRHQRVTCDSCHRTDSGRRVFEGLPFAACTDCHVDPHESRLGQQCTSCHSTAAWSAIPAGAFDHSATDYPLEGAHQNVDCESCHRAGEPLRIPRFERCSTCHEDEHLGQFTERTAGAECSSCHSVDAFVPAAFSEQDHQESRFPLTGLHQGVACVDCHLETTFRQRDGDRAVIARKFRFDELACAGCHQDPHSGTTDAWHGEDGCASCHTDAGWSESRFDHGTTDFELLGAHAEAPCAGCHAREPAPEGQLPLVLTATPTECADCHEDSHGGQFDSRDGGCASCHAPVTWTDLVFDHARDADFSLEGAHAEAPCVSCHIAISSDTPVIYAPLPTRCEGCHGG